MAQSVVLFSSTELLISVGKGKNWNLTPCDWSKIESLERHVLSESMR